MAHTVPVIILFGGDVRQRINYVFKLLLNYYTTVHQPPCLYTAVCNRDIFCAKYPWRMHKNAYKYFFNNRFWPVLRL
jgi:hypothetical protein